MVIGLGGSIMLENSPVQARNRGADEAQHATWRLKPRLGDC